jgi:hypothetical protein
MSEEELIEEVIEQLIGYNERHSNWDFHKLAHLHHSLLKMIIHVEQDTQAQLNQLKGE